MEKEDKVYAVSYVRLAVEDKEAIERQQRDIRKFCEEEDIKLLATFNDIGPGTGSSNMVGWVEMIAFLEQNKGLVSSLVVTNLDRISRNINAFLLQAETLKNYYGVSIQTVKSQKADNILHLFTSIPAPIPKPKIKEIKGKNRKFRKK